MTSLLREWLSVLVAYSLILVSLLIGIPGGLLLGAAWAIWHRAVELLEWGCRRCVSAK